MEHAKEIKTLLGRLARIVTFVFFVFTFGSLSFAQVIHLKSGRSFKAKVIEDNEKQIMVEFPFGTMTFDRTEIERIEETPEADSFDADDFQNERKTYPIKHFDSGNLMEDYKAYKAFVDEIMAEFREMKNEWDDAELLLTQLQTMHKENVDFIERASQFYELSKKCVSRMDDFISKVASIRLNPSLKKLHRRRLLMFHRIRVLMGEVEKDFGILAKEDTTPMELEEVNHHQKEIYDSYQKEVIEINDLIDQTERELVQEMESGPSRQAENNMKEIGRYIETLSVLDELVPGVNQMANLVDDVITAEHSYRITLRSGGDTTYESESLERARNALNLFLESFDRGRQIWAKLGDTVIPPKTLSDVHKKILRGLQSLSFAIGHFKKGYWNEGKKELKVFLDMYNRHPAWLKGALTGVSYK